MKRDIFKGKPWSNLDEYIRLAKEYNLYGSDLERQVKIDRKRCQIPLPVIRNG
jgi:hypothetical protein